MTAKKFTVYRIIIAALLGAIFSISIVSNQYLIPVISLVTAVIIIYMLKKSVKEVLVDERDYEISGKAARYAIMFFSYMAFVIIFFLIIFKNQNPAFETTAIILAYAICSLMIAYSFIFKFLQSDSPLKKNKTIMILVAVILGLFLIIFNLRFFSGEDDWICQNGEWAKHGNPRAPMPNRTCQ
jgi:uncharacterized membrane protein